MNQIIYFVKRYIIMGYSIVFKISSDTCHLTLNNYDSNLNHDQ